MKPEVRVTFMRNNCIFFEADWYYSRTVLWMKTQIAAQINVSVDNLIFVFNGTPLRDEYTREQCGFTNDGCRVKLLLATDTVAIEIVHPRVAKMVVHANVLWTIKHVKAQTIPRIATLLSNDPDCADPGMFDLSVGVDWLDENETVMGLNLKDGDQLQVVKKTRVELTISNSGQTYDVFVNHCLSVGQFKQQLNEVMGIPVNATISVVGHGMMDNNARPLYQFGIGVESESRVIATLPPPPPPPIPHDFTYLFR